jgi:hypothetical protein
MTTALPSTLRKIAQSKRHYGPTATAYWLGSRIIEKLLRLEASELLYLDVVDLPSSIEIDSEFTFRFLTLSEVTRFSQNPSNNLAKDFVARTESRHDLCLAALHREQLASYSWYAMNSIEGLDHIGVPMSYPTNVAYMYNAFTHPEYRGRRLYGAGIALALRKLTQQGVTNLITTINCSNFASLRSCRRLGFSNLGRIWTLGRGARRLALTPRAARQRDISFGKNSRTL